MLQAVWTLSVRAPLLTASSAWCLLRLLPPSPASRDSATSGQCHGQVRCYGPSGASATHL